MTVKFNEHLADDMRPPDLQFWSALERSCILRTMIRFLGVFKVCMAIAGGFNVFSLRFSFALAGI